jgi:hypothetical protein
MRSESRIRRTAEVSLEADRYSLDVDAVQQRHVEQFTSKAAINAGESKEPRDVAAKGLEAALGVEVAGETCRRTTRRPPTRRLASRR